MSFSGVFFSNVIGNPTLFLGFFLPIKGLLFRFYFSRLFLFGVRLFFLDFLLRFFFDWFFLGGFFSLILFLLLFENVLFV